MTQQLDGPSGAKACDLKYLLGNLGGNIEAARRLVHMYLENHPALLRALDVAVQRHDPAAIRQAVHDIRGNCVIFSAETCLDLTRRIEASLRQGAGGESLLAAGLNGSWVEDCATLTVAMDEMAEELRRLIASDLV